MGGVGQQGELGWRRGGYFDAWRRCSEVAHPSWGGEPAAAVNQRRRRWCSVSSGQRKKKGGQGSFVIFQNSRGLTEK